MLKNRKKIITKCGWKKYCKFDVYKEYVSAPHASFENIDRLLEFIGRHQANKNKKIFDGFPELIGRSQIAMHDRFIAEAYRQLEQNPIDWQDAHHAGLLYAEIPCQQVAAKSMHYSTECGIIKRNGIAQNMN